MSASVRRRLWRRFRRAWLEDDGKKHEPPESGMDVPLRLWTGGSRPTHIVYFTKDTLLLRWMQNGMHLPKGWLVLERRGFPEPAYLERFAELVRPTRAPVHVIGDLDPLDLSSFLALRALDQDITRPPALDVTWCGISDPWLRLCRRHLRAGRTSLPVLDMVPMEREHWRVLAEIAPEVRALVGRGSAALLDRGKTLAIEGASGAGFYTDELPGRLLEHVKRTVRKATRS